MSCVLVFLCRFGFFSVLKTVFLNAISRKAISEVYIIACTCTLMKAYSLANKINFLSPLIFFRHEKERLKVT